MKVIRADLEVPFWCSFSEYGTVNIRPTYPFPPPTTLFGLIQNALQKPALHDLNKEEKELITPQYVENYSKLDFAIIIKENGEKIDDYLNIHKGSRELEGFESSLKEKLEQKIDKLDLPEDDKKRINKELNKLKRKKFMENLSDMNKDKKVQRKDEKQVLRLLKLIKEFKADELITCVQRFWRSSEKGISGYNLNKKWISTQINRQRLIAPKYAIYLYSTDLNGEYSLENIYHHLINPKRPLYLGESDDVVNINNIEMMEIGDKETASFKVNSVIPGVYTNSQLVKIPIKLKNDIPTEEGHNLICSIPLGKLEEEVNCFKSEGENIVFLRGDSKE